MFLFAYFYLKIREMSGLACGPPGRWPVRRPQVENRCSIEYPISGYSAEWQRMSMAISEVGLLIKIAFNFSVFLAGS